MRLQALSLTLCALAAVPADASAQVPLQSPSDGRVRYMTFQADSSVVVRVRRGVVTRVVLEAGEAIKLAGTGFPSRCEAEADEWCIRAERGESQIWIKPRTGATHNNLEVATDRRDYSLRLEVLPDAPKGGEGFDEVHRIIFVYPVVSTPTSAPRGRLIASSTPPILPAAVQASGNLADLGCVAPRRVVNAAYSREAKSVEFMPQRIFDDGQHTVFVFGDTSAMPAVFSTMEGGERRVNVTVDGNCLIAHQLSQQFVLRAGGASVRVWNDAYVPGASSPQVRSTREQRAVAE